MKVSIQKSCAYVEHVDSSIHSAASMSKLSITSRLELIVALGLARFILDRRSDLIKYRPNRAAAAGAPLDGAQERHTSTTPQATHATPFTTAKRHSSLQLPCTFAYNSATPVGV